MFIKGRADVDTHYSMHSFIQQIFECALSARGSVLGLGVPKSQRFLPS